MSSPSLLWCQTSAALHYPSILPSQSLLSDSNTSKFGSQHETQLWYHLEHRFCVLTLGNTPRFTAPDDAASFLITLISQPQPTGTVAPVEPRFCFSGAGLFFITASSSVPGDHNHTQILNLEYRQPQWSLQGSLKLPSEMSQPGPPLPALFSDVSFSFP